MDAMNETTFYGMLILILFFTFFCGYFMSIVFKKHKNPAKNLDLLNLEERVDFLEMNLDMVNDKLMTYHPFITDMIKERLNRYRVLDAPEVDDEEPQKERKKPGPKPGFKKKKVAGNQPSPKGERLFDAQDK